MYTKFKFTMLLLMLLAGNLAACSHPPKFVAPEIDPPADLIPGYVFVAGENIKDAIQVV